MHVKILEMIAPHCIRISICKTFLYISSHLNPHKTVQISRSEMIPVLPEETGSWKIRVMTKVME